MTEEVELHAATEDVEFFGIDWGIVAPSTSDDMQFRVFNTSEYYTVQGVELSLPDDSNHYLSDDGAIFAANLVLPDLLPRMHSAAITLRRITSRTAPAGLDSTQIDIIVGAWTPAVS